MKFVIENSFPSLPFLSSYKLFYVVFGPIISVMPTYSNYPTTFLYNLVLYTDNCYVVDANLKVIVAAAIVALL
jgi:hypothetical protein